MAISVNDFIQQDGQLDGPNTEPWTYADAPRAMYYKQQLLEDSQQKTEQIVSHLQGRQNILIGVLVAESLVILVVVIVAIKICWKKLK